MSTFTKTLAPSRRVIGASATRQPGLGLAMSPGAASRGRLHAATRALHGLFLGRSIGARIFRSFLAMLLLMGLLGGWGLYVLSASGDIVAKTYDGPLMAINFARAASLDFASLDKVVLQRRRAKDSDLPAFDDRFTQLRQSFLDDLGVAEARTLSGAERKTISSIRDAFESWSTAHLDEAVADPIADRIAEQFDTLVELTADHSFVERRKAIWAIATFRDTSLIALVVALGVASLMIWFLSRGIVRPLSAAARVADRIAGGELQTPIPTGGRDETGLLLRSMTVMQNNIREALEREQAQRRSAQSRLVDAIEGSREGMVLVDNAGEVVIANSRVSTFFPGPISELISGNLFSLAQPAAEPQAFPEGPIGSALRGIMGEGRAFPREREGEFELGDGRWVRYSQTPTQDGGFFLFLSDVTERRLREESYKDAKQAAEAASLAKSNFLATMTHELRTPLNAVIGFSEIIASEMLGEIGIPIYAEYANDIVRSGKNLLTIINGVLELAKSQAGQLALEAELQSINDVIGYCADQARPAAEQAGLDMQVMLPEADSIIYGDLGKLRQIFGNLLSNAIKFTGRGGSVSIWGVTRADGSVEVRVIDTGIGMSAEEIPVALSPFGQVDSSLSRRYDGTGLGLSLASVFAEMHGATFGIESAENCGTCVTVGFPPLHKTPGAPALEAASARV